MKKKILSLIVATGLAVGTIAISTHAGDDPILLMPKHNSSIAVDDVTGDGKPDIVYVGREWEYKPLYKQFPDFARVQEYNIIVEENQGKGLFKRHKLDITVPDISDAELYLQIKDINGDGLKDIIVKTGNYLAVFKNKDNLKFEENRLY